VRSLSVLLLFVMFFLSSCREQAEVVTPGDSADIFLAGTKQVGPAARAAMEGVYRVVEGQAFFGEYAVLKWSGSSFGADTSFFLSGFFGRDALYFAVKSGSLDSVLFFSGTWRKLVNTEAGLLRATVLSSNGGRQLMKAFPVIGRDSVTITGVWGNGEEDPGQPIVLHYDRPLYGGKNLEIIAHRGGGRTADLLPVSENSLEMVLFTERLGSTAIEIDIRQTKDGVPVLYHDETLNLRLVRKSGLTGEIEEYTYDQLQGLVRLIHGERIPTLREALDAALYRTGLRLIYLDAKPTMSLSTLREIQQEYSRKATAAGRQFELLIGLATEDKVKEFEALAGHTRIPSLCELSVDDVRRINSRVWSPRWTLGVQNDLVAQMHAEGRRAFVWTLDVAQYIEQFIPFYDGILTNYPPTVAYSHYVR
jgi:glycerophosphoryl diester phosphodiesterase